jgi:hypothetical protein
VQRSHRGTTLRQRVRPHRVGGCTTRPAACASFTNAVTVATPVEFHVTIRPIGGPTPSKTSAILFRPAGVHSSSWLVPSSPVAPLSINITSFPRQPSSPRIRFKPSRLNPRQNPDSLSVRQQQII